MQWLLTHRVLSLVFVALFQYLQHYTSNEIVKSLLYICWPLNSPQVTFLSLFLVVFLYLVFMKKYICNFINYIYQRFKIKINKLFYLNKISATYIFFLYNSFFINASTGICQIARYLRITKYLENDFKILSFFRIPLN